MRVSVIVSRRGARTITPEDLLFLLRHDVNRSARLKEFLSWKDVRKNAKATSGAEASGDGAAGANSSGGGDGGIGDDSALVAEIEEDAKTLAASDSTAQDYDSRLNDSDPHGGTGGSLNNKSVQIGPKRRQLGLFWDLGHGLLADLPGSAGSFNDGTSLTSYDSRDQATCQRETLRRLRHADLLTLSMSQAEYMEYSECRQASFTYKKARKFRDWLVGGTARPGSLGLSSLAAGSARDLAKLSDDTLEILGFLAYEIVQKLTEVSLAVKYEYEKRELSSEILIVIEKSNQSKMGSAQLPNSSHGGLFTSKNSEAPKSVATSATQKHIKTPIQTVHVEEAYRKLISANIDGFNLFRHSLNKKRKFIL
jgi:transcription initiation protein SPT3